MNILKKVLKSIFNRSNFIMLIIAILGFIFYIIGASKGFTEICGFYDEKPNFKTIFTTKECMAKIKVNSCLLPTQDLGACYGYTGNLTQIQTTN